MTLTTFDRAVRSIHYAPEITLGSPLSATVEQARGALEDEPVEIVYEVEGGYVVQGSSQAVFVGDDGVIALTDIYETLDEASPKKLRWRRVAPGAYETEEGYAAKQQPGRGLWYLTYPGEDFADDYYGSLQALKKGAQHHADEAAGKGPREDLDETISRSQLNALERMLDQLFSAASIDVEFTKHFFDRVNDPRNGKPITIEELAGIFREVWTKFRKTLEKASVDWQAIIQDIPSAINIPIVMDVNQYGEVELVAKTVMRKKDFTGRAKRLRVAGKATVPESDEIDEFMPTALLPLKGGLYRMRQEVKGPISMERARRYVSSDPFVRDKPTDKEIAKVFKKLGGRLSKNVFVFESPLLAPPIKKGLGIPRASMPQIRSSDVPDFLAYLRERGVRVTKGSAAVGKLKPTQDYVSSEKAEALASGSLGLKLRLPVIVSRDGYILDGHHRWAALFLQGPDEQIGTYRVSVPMRKLLEMAGGYDKIFYKQAGESLSDTEIDEGINDPYILKAVFMTGGAGAGKSFISDAMFGGMGLKVVNSDTQLELAMKKAGLDLKKDIGSEKVQGRYGLRDRAKEVTGKKLDAYLIGRLGLVIDSTAAKVEKVKKQVKRLQGLGYDCYMVFVNTSLETALARNQERPRTVPEKIATADWKKVQANLSAYKALFGTANFREIINDEVLSPKQVVAKLIPHLTRAALSLLNRPVSNPMGKYWVEKQRNQRRLAASYDDEGEPISEDAILLLGLAGSAMLGGILSKITIGAKRAVQKAIQLHKQGKTSAAEIQLAKMSAKDRKQIEALLSGEARRLREGCDEALRLSKKTPATMTAAAINKELDKLDALSSKHADALIAAGRGSERYGDIAKGKDPLSLEVVALSARQSELRAEVVVRMGPGKVVAPSRFPTGGKRGFWGPRESCDEAFAAFERTHLPAGTKPSSSFPKYILTGVFDYEETARAAGSIVRKVKGKGASSRRDWSHMSDAATLKVYGSMGLSTSGPFVGTTSKLPGQPIMEDEMNEDPEELEELALGLDELECLVMDDLSDMLAWTITEHADDVHKVGHLFGEFEEAVRCGDFEKAELLFEEIVKVLPLSEAGRMSTHSRLSRVRNRRRGTTKEIADGKKSKGDVRKENRLRRMARRSRPTSRMKSARMSRSQRSLSISKESMDEAAQTFGKLKKGDRFRLDNDPSNAVLEKTGPTTYRVVSASDASARGLKGMTLKKDKPVLPESIDEEQAIIGEVSPPGWEARVKKMKRDPDIDNPWKLAWYLYNKEKKKNESIDEEAPKPEGKNVIPVYSADRKTVLAYVKKQATSIGAAKAAGARSASQERVGGTLAWIIKEGVEEASGVVLTVQPTKYGTPTYRMKIRGTVGKFEVAGEVRQVRLDLGTEVDLRLAQSLTTVNRAEGGSLPPGATRKVYQAVLTKLKELAAMHEGIDEAEMKFSIYVRQEKQRATGFKNFDAARTRPGTWVLVATNYNKASAKAAADLKLSQGYGKRAIVVAHTSEAPRSAPNITSLPGKVVATLGESLDEDTNAHGIAFGERQLLSMYDDEDEATRGTFEEWRDNHFTVEEESRFQLSTDEAVSLTAAQMSKAKNVVKKHYGLSRTPTDDEVRDEIANVQRKSDRGSLDDRGEMLKAAFEIPSGGALRFESLDEYLTLSKYEVQQRRGDTPKEAHWNGGDLKAAKKKAIELSQTDRAVAYVTDQTKMKDGHSKVVAAYHRGKPYRSGMESVEEAIPVSKSHGVAKISGDREVVFVGSLKLARRELKKLGGRKAGYELFYSPGGKKKVGSPLTRESVEEAAMQYATLNDAATIDSGYEKGSVEIWYMRDVMMRIYGMGTDFMRRHEPEKLAGMLKTYQKSHKLIGKIAERRPERIFGMMQGERWSPNGEARTMLKKLGIHHTSMSVGDIVKIGNKVLFVDRAGFTPLD